jgi:hypothetical protein
MPCYHPVTAYRSKSVNDSGKRSLVFKLSEAIDDTETTIPCGGCVGCRLDHAGQWAARLTHEAKFHEKKCFLTLTYDDLHLPENNQLVVKHLQDFMKKLRRRLNYKHKKSESDYLKLRYFACGEYGETSLRAHYHMILYGCDFSDRKKHSKSSSGDQLWKSEVLDEIWGHGHCLIGSVTPQSCGYVARYIMKKVTGSQANDHYAAVNPSTGEWYLQKPEFVVMSRRPGIGQAYYEKYKDEIFASDSIVINGNEVPVPTYYTKLLAKENSDKHEETLFKRSQRANTPQQRKNSTRARLDARETCHKSKIQTLVRNTL